MTDRASRWLLVDNEAVHCHTFTQQTKANKLLEKSDSLNEGRLPCLRVARRDTGCQNKHEEVDLKRWYKGGFCPADSAIRPQVKDGSGEQMLRDRADFIRPFEGNQVRCFNESNANADSSEMTVRSDVTRAITNQGHEVGEYLPVHSNNGSDKNSTASQIFFPQENVDPSKEDVHNISQLVIGTFKSAPSYEKNDKIGTEKHTKKIQLPKKYNDNIDKIKTSRNDNALEMSSGDNIVITSVTQSDKEKTKQNLNQNSDEIKMAKVDSQPNSNQTDKSTDSKKETQDASPRIGRQKTVRTSSTIRRIQESIRREQLKDMKGKNYVDGNEQTEEEASTAFNAPSVSAIALMAAKNARRQRSKSRTKYGKMKYDQMQRPYRRWLGVSTCIASDTRFIVESDNISANQTTKEDNSISSGTRENIDKTLPNKYPESDEDLMGTSKLEASNSKIGSPSACCETIGCQVEEDLLVEEAGTNVQEKNVKKDIGKQSRRGKRVTRFNTGSNSEFGSQPLVMTISEPMTDVRARVVKKSVRVDEEETPSLRVPAPKETSDVFNRQDGGLAGQATSSAVCEFDDSPSHVTHCKDFNKNLKGMKMLNWELRKYGDPEMLPAKPSKATKKPFETFRTKFRTSQRKPEYINVQAITDSQGKLPGQLSFKKGQIIKQLDTGLNPEDGMNYGYYRVGKLRRKMCGIYASSHVTTFFENSDSDEENKKTDSVNEGKKMRQSRKRS